jgi:hypothetical protein
MASKTSFLASNHHSGASFLTLFYIVYLNVIRPMHFVVFDGETGNSIRLCLVLIIAMGSLTHTFPQHLCLTKRSVSEERKPRGWREISLLMTAN